MSIFLQILFTIVTLASLYALVTVGFTLIYAVTKVLHVALGVVALLAAYLFLAATNRGLSPLVSGAAAIVACAGVGWLMHALLFERLRRHGRLSPVGALIASVALMIMGTNLLQLAFGPSTQSLAWLPDVPRWHLGGAIVNAVDVGTMLTAVLVVGSLGWWLKRATWGSALRAVADNPIMAEVVGINGPRMRALAFALGSGLASIAGIMFGLKFSLEPNLALMLGLKPFMRAVIGGVGSIPGAVFGNLILETAENVGAFYWSNAVKDVVSFGAVLAVLLVRPQGLFGWRKE